MATMKPDAVSFHCSSSHACQSQFVFNPSYGMSSGWSLNCNFESEDLMSGHVTHILQHPAPVCGPYDPTFTGPEELAL